VVRGDQTRKINPGPHQERREVATFGVAGERANSKALRTLIQLGIS